MYGLVNQAMKDLVCSKFGPKKWEEICVASQHSKDDFDLMHSYSDKMTYDMVGAATQVLGMSAYDILRAFGDYWITFTAEQGYGEIMNLFGKDFRTCLKNLNGMHGHMGAMMPHLQPPRFQVISETEQEILLHYFSTRDGLAPMVVGLLEGLARKYGNSIQIEQKGRSETAQYDEFKILVLS